jgi:competence protein ComEC
VGDPLLVPAVATAAGIVTGRLLGMSVIESGWPIAAFLLLAAIGKYCGARTRACSVDNLVDARARLRRSGVETSLDAARTSACATICTALMFFFLGSFTEAIHRPGPPPTIDAGPRETMILEGCVVEPTVLSPSREQFTLELAPHARARVSLTLRDNDPPQRLDYGQHIEIDARIRRPHNYNNPGSFDYAGYLARQDIYWTATMPSGATARILEGRCGSRFMAAVFALRTGAIERIEELYGQDSYSTGMMEAILLGETSKLEKIWTEDFRRTGTFHALVISGVHVTVLAAVLLFFLRLCLIPDIPALAITAFAAWVYALVSGFSAPVVRAAGGFTLYLIARFFFRRGRVMNLLAAVALVYMLLDPGQIFDASFQLSFLCVAAIGALAAPLLERTSAPLSRGLRDPSNTDLDAHMEPHIAQFRVELRLVAETIALWIRVPFRWALDALALVTRAILFCFETALISTVVQIGLALPMALYFHRVSFTGLTANILIVPLLNGVVPIGFGAIFTGWRWLAWIAAALLRVAARIAAWHAAIEPNWRVPDPPLWLALAFVAALIACAFSLKNPAMTGGATKARLPPASLPIKAPPVMAGFGSRSIRFIVIIFAVLATFALLIRHPWRPQLAPGTLELTAIDVGQGDSLLVVFPHGKTMLIDGGGILQFGRQRKPNIDTGEDVVSPYLWHRGIRHIDVIAVTHAHQDHAGGIGALIRNFHPEEIWTGSNPPDLKVRILEKRASPPFPFDDATIEILSPPSGFSPKKPGNNDSLVMRIRYGQRSFLLTGDMEIPMEARLLDQTIRADVLKVGHHGSKTSTMQPFLDAVSPTFAVISVGIQNSFGHPNREVLDRLESRHAAMLRTDVDGLITIRTDGWHIGVDTMSWHASKHLFNWSQAADW